VLTSRQELLLDRVVQAYLDTGVPVGSKALAAAAEWGPSTIRNELALLEEHGLLDHPHTSAGRVPTDAGYRFFVDRLMPRIREARPATVPAVSLVRREVDEAMRAHPDVITALAARGITDLSLVLIEVWTYGKALMPEKYRDRRLGWCDVWYRATPEGNPYAHPVSGLKIVVDMNTVELLEIENDHDYGQPDGNAEYVPGPWTGQLRTDLKPLNITQPEGVSFTVEGTELRWQNWRMRIGFNYREGPVIYQVSYDDHGTERDIAYRLSFAEMIVPYRDASFDHYRRTAFDIGEWGLGFMTTSLELGCDCLGEIVYVDATLHDTRGEPYTIKNAICIHEEDNAVLWKHVDHTTGAEVRRMRRMVVSCHATVANYEYLLYWRFYQDGNIECEVRATGIMVTSRFAPGERPANGAGIPTVINVDGLDSDRGKWNRFAKAYLRSAERLSPRLATRAITDSYAVARIYESRYDREIGVVPYGAEQPSEVRSLACRGCGGGRGFWRRRWEIVVVDASHRFADPVGGATGGDGEADIG